MQLPEDQVYYVSPEQIRQWMQAGEATIVDVRETDEWDQAHIPGATLVPLSTFDIADVPDPGSNHLVFHCRSGRRCGLAAAKALQQGYTGVIKRMEGGFLAWDAAGYEKTQD